MDCRTNGGNRTGRKGRNRKRETGAGVDLSSIAAEQGPMADIDSIKEIRLTLIQVMGTGEVGMR